MLGLTWIWGLVARRRGRLAATAAGVAIAVGLLASIGAFLAASKATMTTRATSAVSVDWQVEAQPGADPAAVLRTTTTASGVRAAVPVEFAMTTGFTAVTGGTTQTTGPGVVLGLPAGYRTTFSGEIRDLGGSSHGVLLAQQTAANLHAAPGDTIEIGRADLPSASIRVAGIVDLPQADTLFQKVGAPVGAQPQAPPDNVLLIPLKLWHETFDPLGAIRPDLVHTQIHVRRSHQLPSDPAAAFKSVSSAAANLEVHLAGTGLVGDNLGATLAAARSDALYAQILFLFLGLPGAVLAGLLTAAAAGSGAERRRREQALLRTRGATTRDLVCLGVFEALVVGGVGALPGLGVAAVVGQIAFGTADFGATTATALGWGVGAAVVGLGIAALAVALPAWRDAKRLTVAAARQTVGRTAPRWARFGLDFILLATGAIVFWLTSRNGYQLVLAPEGTPSISVSYWTLAGPALSWIGAGLLAWRIANGALTHGRGAVARAIRPFSRGLAETVAASMARQRRTLASALALVTLTVAFAASTAVFNSTYKQQAEVDARLSNGADVTVTESPGTTVGSARAATLTKIPGVRTVEPIQHRFAYVGTDLQDLYGVRPDTIVNATKLQDAYFQGGSVRQLMAKLAATPDGLLVSDETVKDFQLTPNDKLTLRLQDGRTKQYTDVVFHYIGIAKEFPTAPSDSFLVANATYVAQQTGTDAVGAFLLDTGGTSPKAVAARVRASVGTSATVTDLETSRRVIGSSLTSVDLSGLTRVELGFAIVLAAAATGLILALGTAERRRTFAIASALGAKSHQIGAFVWSEAAYVTIGGLALGAIAGSVLAAMLVKVLTGVFDPPPATLAVPWLYLGTVAAVAIAAVAVASYGAVRRARRSAVEVLREL